MKVRLIGSLLCGGLLIAITTTSAFAANPLAELGRAAELLCWYDGKSYSSGSIVTQADKNSYVCTNKAITMTAEPNAPNAMVGAWQKK